MQLRFLLVFGSMAASVSWGCATTKSSSERDCSNKHDPRTPRSAKRIPKWEPQTSGVDVNLRGISAVSDKVLRQNIPRILKFISTLILGCMGKWSQWNDYQNSGRWGDLDEMLDSKR